MPYVVLKTGTTIRVDTPTDITYVVLGDPSSGKGGTLDVASGGAVTGAQSTGNGSLILIEAGGTATGSLLINGYGGDARQNVYGYAFGTSVQSGGSEYVYAGGTATGSTVTNASQYVQAGGTAIGTQLLYRGRQDVASGGLAIRTAIGPYATQTIASGGSAKDATVDFGEQYVQTGATAQNTGVNNGGVQWVYGTVTGSAIRFGGVQHVYFGGNATGTVIAAGGFQNVTNILTDPPLSIVTDTDLSGAQQILARGKSVHTVIRNGGYQYVGSGGLTVNTSIETGGYQYIDVGALATDTTVVGGTQIVAGSTALATGTVVDSGGVQHVLNGGRATGTVVTTGGFQDVYSATITDTALTGNLQVMNGGASIRTIVGSGGGEYVGAGGTTTDTVVNAGGKQYVDSGATANHTTINGGQLFVGGSLFTAGVANNAVVNDGGVIEIGNKGVAIGSKLVHGVELVHLGGTAQDVDFAGLAATLTLENPFGLAGTVSNFETGDTIDLLNTSVSSYAFDGSTLTLATSSGGYAYKFANVQAGTTFNIGSDGHGGTAISLSLLVQSSASLVPDAGIESTMSAPEQTQAQIQLANVHA